MSHLQPNSVNLTVTSPPYSNAIDYEAHASDNTADYRARQEIEYEQYLAFLGQCFAEVFRVSKPGAFCAVVIGTVLERGTHVPLPFHFLSRMLALGWQFHQDIIWSKCTGGVKRAGSTIQHPYPGYYYPNLMTEYILVFRKPGEQRIYQGRTAEEKQANRFAIDAVFTKDIANNIWHIAPVPPGQLDHPCPFPEEIPYRLLRLYSYAGDVVLDPFCGVGTTIKVAQSLGRRWVGYEVLEKYRDIATRRACEPLVLRKQLIVGYEKVEYGQTVAPTRTVTGKKRAPFRRKGEPSAETGEETNLLLFERASDYQEGGGEGD